MARLLTLLAATLSLTCLTVSCNTSGCTDNQNSLPLAGFYSNETGQPISLDSIGIHGIGAPGDSMLVTPGRSVTQVYLPLRSQQDSTAYCFSYRGPGLNDPALNDTITMVYSSWPYFSGEECGAAYRYNINILEHTSHLIDSIALTSREVTNVDREIIKIYFKTTEPTDSLPGEEDNDL